MLTVTGCNDRRADLLAYHGKRLVLDLSLSMPVTIHIVPDLVGMRGGYMTEQDGSHTIYIADQCHTLTAVLAHELRHAYQAEQGNLGEYEWQRRYSDRKHEKDADRYATDYVSRVAL